MKSLFKALYPVYFAIAICLSLAIKSHSQVSGWPYPFTSFNPFPTSHADLAVASDANGQAFVDLKGNVADEFKVISFAGSTALAFYNQTTTHSDFAASDAGINFFGPIEWGVNGNDINEVNAPRSTVAFFDPAGGATFLAGSYEPSVPIHLRRFHVFVGSIISGCTTQETVAIAVNGTAQASSDLTFANSASSSDYDVSGLSIAVAAGAKVSGVNTVNAAGCGTFPGNVQAVIEYSTD